MYTLTIPLSPDGRINIAGIKADTELFAILNSPIHSIGTSNSQSLFERIVHMSALDIVAFIQQIVKEKAANNPICEHSSCGLAELNALLSLIDMLERVESNTMVLQRSSVKYINELSNSAIFCVVINNISHEYEISISNNTKSIGANPKACQVVNNKLLLILSYNPIIPSAVAVFGINAEEATTTPVWLECHSLPISIIKEYFSNAAKVTPSFSWEDVFVHMHYLLSKHDPYFQVRIY